MYEDHPLWIATKQMLTQAYVDLAAALGRLDRERVEEEQLNILGLRESATFVFSERALDLDFSALCDALSLINQAATVPVC